MIHPVVCNPVLSPLVGILNPPRWRAGRNAPLDSILHWDADIDAFSEQTGGPHTFNHAVLSPQYQLGADGSYINVGAKPAVDVFDGQKWLRSCGAVQNLLTNSVFAGAVSGTPGTAPTGWSLAGFGGSIVFSGVSLTFSASGARNYVTQAFTAAPSTTYYFEFRGVFDGVLKVNEVVRVGSLPPGATLSYSVDASAVTSDNVPSAGNHVVAIVATISTTGGTPFVGLGVGPSGTATGTVTISDPQLTASAYPQPYVPTTSAGPVTQPASNATTTNGMWFALPAGSPVWQALDGDVDGVELYSGIGFVDTQITKSGGMLTVNTGYTSGLANRVFISVPTTVAGTRYLISCRVLSPTVISAWLGSGYTSVGLLPVGNARFVCVASDATTCPFRLETLNGSIDNISIQRIQPQPLTLATRVRMGVGSGDITTSSSEIACYPNSPASLIYHTNTPRPVSSYDFSSAATPPTSASWSRLDIIKKCVQINAAGTQFRVGYMIEGTHTTIQWGSWVNFDGSFNPSTLYRLMLGFGNAYPIWFNKITAWREQVSDARILEAMA